MREYDSRMNTDDEELPEGWYRMESGQILTGSDLDALGAEAEAGYDVETIRPTGYQVPCPWCRHVSYWRDGASAMLSASLLDCPKCDRRYVVVVHEKTGWAKVSTWRRSSV